MLRSVAGAFSWYSFNIMVVQMPTNHEVLVL